MSENWITWHGITHDVPQEYQDLRAVLEIYLAAHPGTALPPLYPTPVVRDPGPRPEIPEAPQPEPRPVEPLVTPGMTPAERREVQHHHIDWDEECERIDLAWAKAIEEADLVTKAHHSWPADRASFEKFQLDVDAYETGRREWWAEVRQ